MSHSNCKMELDGARQDLQNCLEEKNKVTAKQASIAADHAKVQEVR